MKASEIRKKTPKELQGELHELLREQFNLRMQKATGQLGKPHRFRQLRREIARIKTVLDENRHAEDAS